MDLYSLPTLPPNFDRLGIFYIAFCATWTTLILFGMGFLILNRQNPIIKIRGLPLSLVAVCMLHAYWILGQIVYPIGQTIPVILAYDIQYFFMGIWFPLGIALFHASNLRFLHVAKLQKLYTESEVGIRRCNGSKTSWLCRLRRLDYSVKVFIFVGFGMILQILLTIGMWLACRKYHPSFGIPGTQLPNGTLEQQLVALGRGWEWWPTVLWQVIWTWIVAPYMIIKAWRIKDTLGWRVQTIGCCISNLHATPMFLVASYVPAFAPINKYFTPSNWIDISILLFEVFTIFVPCWQVLQYRALQKKAVESNTKWTPEPHTPVLTATPAWKSSFSLSLAEEGRARSDINSMDDDRLFTMAALEHVLRTNPTPLQDFSALRDFSGENIAFLARVTEWKASWCQSPHLQEDQIQAGFLFTRALTIYTSFVSPRDAEFPVNLSSQQIKSLEEVFERPARIICGEGRINPAVPFDFDEQLEPKAGSSDEDGAHLDLGEVSSRMLYTGDIPSTFNADVFDEAHAHVKYLVFTNTWPKFVKELRSQRPPSSETQRSEHSWSSQKTLVNQVAKFVTSIF